MIIYSEITGETYDSVDACLDAEIAHRKAEKEEEEAKEKAYQEAIEACDRYLKLMGIEVVFDEDDDEEEEEIEIEIEDDDDIDDELFIELIKSVFENL